jgi:hypothetical protein
MKTTIISHLPLFLLSAFYAEATEKSPGNGYIRSLQKNYLKDGTLELSSGHVPTRRQLPAKGDSPVDSGLQDPTDSPIMAPTKFDSNNGSKVPTVKGDSPVDSGLQDPTDSPIMAPTKFDSNNGPKVPTVKGDSPVDSGLQDPTDSPTMAPTKFDSKNGPKVPTVKGDSPVDSGVQDPTDSPPMAPTKFDSKNGPKAPTVKGDIPVDSGPLDPTDSPTMTPTKYDSKTGSNTGACGCSSNAVNMIGVNHSGPPKRARTHILSTPTCPPSRFVSTVTSKIASNCSIPSPLCQTHSISKKRSKRGQSKLAAFNCVLRTKKAQSASSK